MPLTKLNKEQLHQAILAGCQSLINQKELVTIHHNQPLRGRPW